MYEKAEDIFPKEVLELIQKYVDGKCVYIPKKKNTRKKWGENTGINQELKLRNENIIKDYKNNLSKSKIAKKYFLSLKSIDRIIKTNNKDK